MPLAGDAMARQQVQQGFRSCPSFERHRAVCDIDSQRKTASSARDLIRESF